MTREKKNQIYYYLYYIDIIAQKGFKELSERLRSQLKKLMIEDEDISNNYVLFDNTKDIKTELLYIIEKCKKLLHRIDQDFEIEILELVYTDNHYLDEWNRLNKIYSEMYNVRMAPFLSGVSNEYSVPAGMNPNHLTDLFLVAMDQAEYEVEQQSYFQDRQRQVRWYVEEQWDRFWTDSLGSCLEKIASNGMKELMQNACENMGVSYTAYLRRKKLFSTEELLQYFSRENRTGTGESLILKRRKMREELQKQQNELEDHYLDYSMSFWGKKARIKQQLKEELEDTKRKLSYLPFPEPIIPDELYTTNSAPVRQYVMTPSL